MADTNSYSVEEGLVAFRSITPVLHKCSDTCRRGHGDASTCASSIKVHMWTHWTCNHALVIQINYDKSYLHIAWCLVTSHPLCTVGGVLFIPSFQIVGI